MRQPTTEMIERDPFLADCLPRLMTANRDHRLDEFDSGTTETVSDASGEAALELARWLGACRVLGINLPDEFDGEMLPTMAIAVAHALKRRLADCIASTNDLPAIASTVLDSEELIDVCADLIDCRFYSYFAEEVLIDAWISAWDSRHPAAMTLKNHNTTIREFIEEFDRVLLENVEHFEQLALTSYFHNWRIRWDACTDALAPPWISGKMEPSLLATQNTRSVRQTPSTAAWKEYSPRLLSATDIDKSSHEMHEWLCPADRSLSAIMIVPIPPKNGDDTEVQIAFEHRDERPAQHMEGRLVECAGCATTIDRDGKAVFTYGQLRLVQQSLNLTVDGLRWEYQVPF